MIAQAVAQCACGPEWWKLVLAGIGGSLMWDAAYNFYLWQRGIQLPDKRYVPRRWPGGLTLPVAIKAALLRAAIAAGGVALLSPLAVDAITTMTAAAGTGVALPEILSAFAGIQVPGVPLNEDE